MSAAEWGGRAKCQTGLGRRGLSWSWCRTLEAWWEGPGCLRPGYPSSPSRLAWRGSNYVRSKNSVGWLCLGKLSGLEVFP